MEKMDELLAKYMLGEANLEETRTIDEWVKASEDNLKYFTHFKLIWETGALLKIESKLDVDESWAEFKQLSNIDSSAKVKTMSMPIHWLKIAAIWLVLFGVALLIYTELRPAKVRMLALQTNNEVKTDTLSDGSVITLNKHSLVSYPDRFTGDTREIRLNKGEAFFDIAHNKSKPFIIHINDAVVKVVGTSFNIQNTDMNTLVVVESGVVQVIKKKVIIRLTPKETAVIDHRSGIVKKGLSTDQFYNYYRTKQLIADKTPLWRVVEVLNQAYGAHIVIANKTIANRPLSTTLLIGSLDQNLNVIRETFNVQIIHTANKISIQ